VIGADTTIALSYTILELNALNISYG